MKLINRWTLAAAVAEEWRRLWEKSEYWKRAADRQVTYRRLLALGANPAPDDVDRVIGNGSWTAVPPCDECKENPGEVIEMGEPRDCDSSTARLCAKCLLAAIMLVNP